MQCPLCKAADTKVTDSRLVSDTQEVRRRRECIICNERFTTYEVVELSLPRLIKKDGSYVQFEEEKLKSGILRSLHKRPIATVKIEALINKIIKKLRKYPEKEVSTKLLGEWVMLELKSLDEVAYLRFASVYGCFSNIDQFKQVIENLQQEIECITDEHEK